MYSMYIADSDGPILFPVTPAKISMKINNQNKTLTLINEGEVNLIKTPGLTDITIDELLLPAIQNYPFAVYEDGFHNAEYYLNKLEQWKNAKNPVKFIMTRTSPDNTVLMWDTNMDVTIENYEIIEDVGKYGFDVEIKLSMKQYRFFGAKRLEITKKKSSTKKTAAKKKKTRKTKTPETTYTVKAGDWMWNIAKKKLGNSLRWKEIYNLNKSTIESWAKKYGHKSAIEGTRCWIFPGEKLKLPKK